MTKVELAKRISEADPGGPLHIVIDDGNCEDAHLEFCRGLPDLQPSEEVILDALSELTLDERCELLWPEPY